MDGDGRWMVDGGECMVMGGFWDMALHGIGVIRRGACGCGLVVAFGYPRRLLFVVVMYFCRHGK